VVAFLRQKGQTPIPVWDVWRADDTLGPGRPLDDMFYTGSEYGFVLIAKHIQDYYQVGFGYQKGPNAGWGKIYLVSFQGDAISSCRDAGQWYDSWSVFD